jgi:DNA replication protein DnaC
MEQMNEATEKQLRYLGLKQLGQNWDSILKQAFKEKPSFHRFLSNIIHAEYTHRKEARRLARLKRAKIPEALVMETFPFVKQSNLKKRLVLELYDSMRFITEPQDLVFIGPTGCGKTGLSTAFLIHALNHDYRGCFIEFKDLLHRFLEAMAGHTERKLIRRFQSFDILLIDELGVVPLESEQAGLFFDLLKQRHKKRTTLFTTQLGFDEWGSFLRDSHLTAAILDRITVNCTVFNMKQCISLRPKQITYATSE